MRNDLRNISQDQRVAILSALPVFPRISQLLPNQNATDPRPQVVPGSAGLALMPYLVGQAVIGLAGAHSQTMDHWEGGEPRGKDHYLYSADEVAQRSIEIAQAVISKLALAAAYPEGEPK